VLSKAPPSPSHPGSARLCNDMDILAWVDWAIQSFPYLVEYKAICSMTINFGTDSGVDYTL
jgi:hypothetical protein